MPERVSPSMNPRQSRADARQEILPPPRAMANAAQRGNRRRAWPRWTRTAIKLTLALLPLGGLAGGGAWVWKQGTAMDVAADVNEVFVNASAGAGYVLGDVLVEGRTETERDAVLGALGVQRGDPILAIDLEDARERLESLPWVSTAQVERRLPDLLYVRLTERQPMAIWQHERRFTVIDREGRPLADAAELARRGNKRVEQLPHVVGANATQHVSKLLTALEKVPTIHRRYTAAIWVADRRWDLKLDNGVVIKLPEAGVLTALRQLAEMETTAKVLERDIVAIDLRQPDRAVLQQSTAAVPEEDPKKKNGKKT